MTTDQTFVGALRRLVNHYDAGGSTYLCPDSCAECTALRDHISLGHALENPNGNVAPLSAGRTWLKGLGE